MLLPNWKKIGFLLLLFALAGAIFSVHIAPVFGASQPVQYKRYKNFKLIIKPALKPADKPPPIVQLPPVAQPSAASGKTSLPQNSTVNSTGSPSAFNASSAFSSSFLSATIPAPPRDAKDFMILDELTDVADRGKNTFEYRIHQQPRLLYTDESGYLQQRPKDWHLFFETPQSKLSIKAQQGYRYKLPGSSTETAIISSGVFEYKKSKILLKPNVVEGVRERNKKSGRILTRYENIYDNIHVTFTDFDRSRRREIIIAQQPQKLVQDETLIFWEAYELPDGAFLKLPDGTKIMPGDTELEARTHLVLHLPDGDNVVLNSAVIFDVSGMDTGFESLRQIARLDAKGSRFFLGTQVPAAYLLDSKRKYPVTIDPTLIFCGDSLISEVCEIRDLGLYRRSTGSEGANPIDSATLQLGLGPLGSLTVMRVPLLRFFGFSIPSNGTIQSAGLQLTYDGTGLGSYNGAVDTVVRRVTTAWNTNNVTYSQIQPGLQTVAGSARQVNGSDCNTAGQECSWNITDAVRTLYAQGAANYEFVLEETPVAPPVGLPSWPNRIYNFASADHSTLQGPFFHVNVEFPDPPDLVVDPQSTVVPATAGPGQEVTAQLFVLNQGTGESRIGDAHFYWDGRLIATRRHGVLIPGQRSTRLDVPFQIPFGAALGTHTLAVRVDANNRSQESNENNNDREWQIQVVAAADLVPEAPVISAAQVTPFQRLTYEHRVRNNSASAPAQSSRVAYYFEAGTAPTFSQAAFFGSWYHDPIGANSVSNLRQGAFTIPNVAPGNYILYFQIDADNEVPESIETNNVHVWQLQVVPPSSDIAISNLQLTNGTFFQHGDTVQLSARLQNLGSADALDIPYRIALRDVGGATYPLSNFVPQDIDLGAGADAVLTMSAQIPASVPLGIHASVDVVLDPLQALNDPDRSNNSATAAQLIYIDRASYIQPPDPGVCLAFGFSDIDCDSFADAVEVVGGTNINGTQLVAVNGVNTQIIYRSFADGGVRAFAGDPVNTRTGAFEFTQLDFELPGRGIPIRFERTYNSKVPDDINNRTGWGWSSSYAIYAYEDPLIQKVFINFGGKVVAQFDIAGPDSFVAPKGVHDTLERDTASGGLIYKTIDGIRYIFSNEVAAQMHLLERIVDTNNNATQFAYLLRRDIPLLASVTDASGRLVEILYGDPQSIYWDKLAQVRYQSSLEPNPRIIQYEYDAGGNLIRVRNSRSYGTQTEFSEHFFTYDENHQMVTYTDPRGTVLHNEYDSEGRVVRQFETNPRVDTGGARRLIYEFTYEGPASAAPASTKCTLVKNYRSAADFYTQRDCFNADELLVYREDGLQNGAHFEYNQDGMMIEQRDALGRVSRFEYDAQRRMTREILPDTTQWHTEVAYTYEPNFNRVLTRTESVQPAGGGALAGQRITTNTIDSANGNLLATRDALGATESFAYDSFGNVLSHAGKKGEVRVYGYDSLGNYRTSERITVQQADGTPQQIQMQYGYDAFGNRVEVRGPRGQVTRFEYDTRGNVRKRTDALGGEMRMRYDLEDNVIERIDERGNITHFVYDTDIENSLLRETHVGASAGRDIVRSFEYDFLGTKIAEVDPLGRRTTLSYDRANRLQSMATPVDTMSYTYDAVSNRLSETNSLQQRTEFVYDARNRVVETRRAVDAGSQIVQSQSYDMFGRIGRRVDPRGNASTYTYDALDRLLTEADALNNVWTYTYDANGNRLSERDPLNNSTTFAYDGLDRLVSTTNAAGKISLSFYDEDGNAVRVIDRQNSDGTQAGHVTTYTYDLLNRQTRETDAYGNYLEYAYDAVRNRLSARDKAGNLSQFSYDEFNRRVSEQDPSGAATGYLFDAAGNVTRMTYADGTAVNYEYDAGNRRTVVRDALAGERHFTYDAAGNVLSERDKSANVTNFVYDRLNRLVRETNALGTVTAYGYDLNGNRVSEVTSGKTRSWSYDALDRLQDMREGGAVLETFTYDGAGNVLTKTDGNSAVISYQYDELHRRTQENLPEGTAVIYSYDNWDNLLAVQDVAASATYSYDLLNRAVGETHTYADLPGRTYTIGRSFDANGDVTQVVDASGKQLNYTYNSRRLVSSAALGAQQLASYQYNLLQRLTQITYGNGVVSAVARDALQRTTGIALNDPSSATLWQQTYGYDAESNRTNMDDNGWRTVQYQYDALHQLTSMNDGLIPESYAYDVWGNRTSFNARQYSYSTSDNRLLSHTDGKGITDMSYDGNGNLTEELRTSLNIGTLTPASPTTLHETLHYGYDSRHRLIQIDNEQHFRGARVISNYAYDAAGNRIKKEVDGVAQYYVVAGADGTTSAGRPAIPRSGMVLNELSAVGDVTNTLVAGMPSGGGPEGGMLSGAIAEIDATGTVTYLHQDVLGSTILQTDTTGAPLQIFNFGSYGAITASQGPTTSPQFNTNYLYTGQEFDTESELVYMNARYYAPTLGRFLSFDPALLSGGGYDASTPSGHRPAVTLSRNPYIYALNNPLRYTDPTGEEARVAVGLLPRVEEGSVYKDADAGIVENEVAGYWVPGIGFIIEFFSDVPVAGESFPEGMIYNEHGELVPEAVQQETPAPSTENQQKNNSSTNFGAGAVLNDAQQKNFEKFKKKLPKSVESIEIKELPGEGKAFRARVPAEKVPDSFAIYEKQVNRLGKTLEYTKTVFKKGGETIVHITDKIRKFRVLRYIK
ncbi:hypothetical protein COV82_02515 [Candidatus Peregrinibacteria bacterium CG11_big_fil_rev_8_21_14_0_20_46_8]|nr:MAG: hypothetical protein COV82_02515 [Candidatus Peregrinibacteria bacterium CG11_big_fil_rev_8_21_14_0_20_46_8]